MVRIALGLRRFVRAGWRRRSVVGRGPVPGGLFRGGEGIHGVRSHPYGKGLTSTARDSHRGPARTADPVRRTKALTRTGPPSPKPSPEPARGRAASLMRGTPRSGPSPRCEATRPPGRALDAGRPSPGRSHGPGEPGARTKPWTGDPGARTNEDSDPRDPSARTKPGPGGIPASERSSGLGVPGARTRPWPLRPNTRTKPRPGKSRRPGQALRPREPFLGDAAARRDPVTALEAPIAGPTTAPSTSPSTAPPVPATGSVRGAGPPVRRLVTFPTSGPSPPP